ncbi:MAG: cytochrome c biogenesis protein CcsA [Saprospiraceae bacterium]|jgi:heme exporter protein C|nr:cytochrome c biogenesis protein CcsA [Saprospiraceae bacterium]
MSVFKQYWWKALGVLLVLYSLVAGILFPLKPGILESSPTASIVDTTIEISIHGYNSHYISAGENRVWLKLSNEFMILATAVRPLSETNLVATFQIPPFLPVPEQTADCAIVLDNAIDGPAVKPTALFLRQTTNNVDMGFAYWKKDLIQDLHDATGVRFPFRGILEETIRNTYYHVPMWFGMIFLFLGSLVFSIKFLRGKDPLGAEKTRALNMAGLLFGILGLLTGMIWAKFTWNAFWSMDVKQNMAAISTLIYLAYFMLRSAIEDEDKRDRVTSAYNIFAFFTLIPLLFIIPRMTDSLHPGNGGNPAFGGEDLDNTMRLVFYPAVLGWTLIGFWLADLYFRTEQLTSKVQTLINDNQ